MSHLNFDTDEFEETGFDGMKIRNSQTNLKQNKGKVLLKQKGNQQVARKVNPFEETSYPFSYHASRHEKQWMMDSLGELHEQNWIRDVIGMVRGGKEATVYLCAAPENMEHDLLAAKVYRPRRFRNLKKDHLYREGRDQLDATGKIILDDRAHHAMQKKTSFGLELLHSSWLGHEFHTMELLWQGGVDIPRPYASSDNAIIMDYVGDIEESAPALNMVSLTTTEAKQLYQRVVHNIELMLNLNRVHADLSAYNILYWNGEIRLIDFPQAVNPEENHNAWRIFQRDVTRVCEYFIAQGVRVEAIPLAEQLWKERGRKLFTPIDPLYLDAEKAEDRRAWDQRDHS